MNKEQFEKMLEELLYKIDEGPGSHSDSLKALAGKNLDVENFREISELLNSLNDSLGAIRIVLKYLIFDLEATRRERDQLRTLLGDKE